MKITKTKLKQIIQEELSAVLGEGTMGFADALNKPAEGSTNWCKDMLVDLGKAEAEMNASNPGNFGAMAGGQMPMYDADAAYADAAGNYETIKAKMEKNGCIMPENH